MDQVTQILRALLRGVLGDYGRDAPALTDIILERGDGRFRPRLEAQFSDGRSAWTDVRAVDFYEFCAARSAWDLHSLHSALFDEAREIYGRMLTEHVAGLERSERSERLEQLQPDGEAHVARARREAHALERELQRAQRRRNLDDIRRHLSLPEDDGPPRLGGWWLRRWSAASRAAVTRWATLNSGGGRSAQAEARADQLLAENLSQAQRDQFRRCGYFEVTGGESGKRYRIRRGSQMNIEELDRSGRRRHVLCFMPEGRLADGDVMLAQKVALESFEYEALAIANRMHPCFSRMDWAR